MLHDISTYSRIGSAARDRDQAPEAGAARINPWLLWRTDRPHARQVLTVAELSECQCPDICNRDHPNE